MTLRVRCMAVACLLALAASGLHAQRGQGRGTLVDPSQFPPAGGGGGRGRFGGPQAQNDPNAPKGTARLAGRVVSTDTGSPVRRAQVQLNAQDLRINRTAITDSDGRYEFTGLAAGRYRIRVSKTGYVTLEYGQARPFEAGKPFDVADAQNVDKIDFSLPRGSVIAGRISDEFGDPLPDAQVQAMRYQYVNGQRQLQNAGRIATTDDIGQFRIFGLMPGEYIVRASVRAGAAPFAAIAGAFAGAPGPVTATAGAAPADAPASDTPNGYAPMYYPGTPDVASAQNVAVGLGQEVNTVSFALTPAKLAKISGTVLDSGGHPLTGAVVLLRASNGGGGLGGPFNFGGANQVRSDGSFTLTNVAPGDYILDVQERPRGFGRGGANASDAGLPEFASIPLSVTGADVSGIVITTTPGASVSGKVVLQGQKASTTQLRTMQVTALAPSGQQALGGIAGRILGGGRVGDDGTFQLQGLAGPQFIRVSNVPAGWVLKSIVVEGQDITDAPYDFRAGRDLTNMTITLSDQISDLTGTVRDNAGTAVTDYVLVVFPDNNKLWGGQSRYVRVARPNQAGAYEIKGLPAENYLAAVVDSLEDGTQSDPAVLEALRARAKAFRLSEGQALKLDLSFQP